MTEIREEQQAAALRVVADASARRTELLTEADRILDEEIKPAAITAARAGAERNRIRELARVGPTVLYRWLTEAGLPVRAKRPPGRPDA
ncbi:MULTISPECIES: hypothetical protein [unclassified Streptomyces]|uniref:hypothetical protein n=1 Tax=unclassified Streptomyces TaxID=2593676 RepID=UPI000F5BF405|nr:hypothetical protein [Streptomyces sp. ADI95-17]RPK62054.1 hypothetical protein EES42_31045 [Streptomyces sp. ADI95-17]WSW99166.1 hypothetical protein OG355_01040 [Streptomyces sp. NBC_00987]